MSVWHRADIAACHAAIHSCEPAIAAGIHYSQDPNRWSGIDQRLLPPHHWPSHADCSSFVTWLFWQARVRVRGHAGDDIVNDRDWKGGFTGSMLQNGIRHQHGVSAFIPGATVVFYDNNAGVVDHCALYVGAGRVVSNGQEIDPNIRAWNYRHVAQARRYPV